MSYMVVQEDAVTGELTHSIGPFADRERAERFVANAAPLLAQMVRPSIQRVVELRNLAIPPDMG